MSNELVKIEMRMALTSLQMALNDVTTEEDRALARAMLFESPIGDVVLVQLEDTLGLGLVELDEVVHSLNFGPLTIEMMHSAEHNVQVPVIQE